MLRRRLGKELLIFDGGMGSSLQQLGLKAGQLPELLNITNPDIIQKVHEDYLRSGCDIITMNTFGANPHKLDNYDEVILAAYDNANKARISVGKDAYIALDIGPIGALLEPMGTLSFDEAYSIIQKQIMVVKDKVDLILFETMSDLYEVKAGILAAKECCDLPIFVTMTFEQSGRTLFGCNPTTMVNVCEGLGCDAVGVNCSLGPTELKNIVSEIVSCSHLPIIVQPNAGLPVIEDGKTVYPMTKEAFVEAMIEFSPYISVIGGCCGTTYEFIDLLSKTYPRKIVRKDNAYKTVVSSGMKSVTLGEGVVVCGERINPTGKKKLKKALTDGNLSEIVVEGIKQEERGAAILDVNVGMPGINEPIMMKDVVKKIQEVITLPLQIDSSNIEALELGCRYYNGRPLINSVNGKQSSMDAIFPIAKKYGGIVVALTLDENGIPSQAIDRYHIAKKIIEEASKYGIHKENIVIDCLTLTVSTNQKEVMETIKAVKMVKELGVCTVLGVSNVSFGLPNRPLLNRTFLSMAMCAGLDLPIINPLDQEMMDAVLAFNVLNNTDINGEYYISQKANVVVEKIVNNQVFNLDEVVYKGLVEKASDATKKALETKGAMEIIEEILIPTLQKVGDDYESGKMFLPQLVQSAETTKAAFEVLKTTFKKQDSVKGPIILATVEGDIHDIGKNIVKVVLESYGYEVVDLGKDVPVSKIIDAYYKCQPKLIGLSALMTTTVANMEQTIIELKKIEGMCPIVVGGAVLTYDYAMKIGADYYSKDALENVNIANEIIK